jgi:hypothetical protein
MTSDVTFQSHNYVQCFCNVITVLNPDYLELGLKNSLLIRQMFEDFTWTLANYGYPDKECDYEEFAVNREYEWKSKGDHVDMVLLWWTQETCQVLWILLTVGWQYSQPTIRHGFHPPPILTTYFTGIHLCFALSCPQQRWGFIIKMSYTFLVSAIGAYV